MADVLITTVPFGDKDRYPLDHLEQNGIDYLINPIGRKLTEDELAEMVGDYKVIVAGTEPITRKVMDNATNLQLISRVGIGLDSVDLLAARDKGIRVSYTPDAPAPAVVELTMGLVYSLLRHVQTSNTQMHRGEWHRYFGARLVNATVGIIGVGRIGSSVLRNLEMLGCSRILYNDLEQKPELEESGQVSFAGKEQIYQQCDLISLHVPLTAQTKNMITSREIETMKQGALLINTARGGIINEVDLYHALSQGHLAGAAIDVFEQEPYDGELRTLDNCILTAHMGSMSVDCRTEMEIKATEEAVRFLKQGIQQGAVPQEEYDVQQQGL